MKTELKLRLIRNSNLGRIKIKLLLKTRADFKSNPKQTISSLQVKPHKCT